MTKEELIPLINKGLSLKEIADYFGFKSVNGAWRWLKKYNLTTQKNITMIKNRKHHTFDEYNWIDIQKYYDNGNSWLDVLDQFNIPNTFLQKARKKGLFKTRTLSESLKSANKLGRVDRSFINTEWKKKLSNSMKFSFQTGRSKGWYHINSRKDRRSYPERSFLKYFKNTEIYNKYLIEEKLPVWKYFLDFAIVDLKLNIEIDGSQHYRDENSIQHDKERNEYLKSIGWKIYRIKWADFKENAKEEIKELVSYINDIHNKSDRFYTLDFKVKACNPLSLRTS